MNKKLLILAFVLLGITIYFAVTFVTNISNSLYTSEREKACMEWKLRLDQQRDAIEGMSITSSTLEIIVSQYTKDVSAYKEDCL